MIQARQLKKSFTLNRSLLLTAILLLPLFYVNVKDTHDWGDDFAQYFIQARNILEHRPQTDNGLVFDQETGAYALQAYPVGFPLILAASWFCFGDSMVVSSIAISIFFFAFGLIAFLFFRKYFSEIISILLTLIIIYNPFTLGFKREILSDVPFAFFMMLGVLLFQSEKKKTAHHLLTGMVWGFALSVRGIGACIFLAAAFYLLQTAFAGKSFFISAAKKMAVVVCSALGFYLVLNAVLFPVPSKGILNFYKIAVQDEDFSRWLLLNLNYYYEVFLNFFSTMGGKYRMISAVSKFILVACIPLGMMFTWYKKIDFSDWVCFSYLLILFVYPYLGGGFRFLLPVLPFLLRYIANACHGLLNMIRINSPVPVVVFLVIVFLQYMPGITDQVKYMHIPEQGPQEKPAVDAFNYISKLPEDAVVVFLKPRALSFYTGKKAAYVARNTQPAQVRGLFARINAHYFLVCNENEEVNDVMLNNFISANKNELKLIYQNNWFDLYTDLK